MPSWQASKHYNFAHLFFSILWGSLHRERKGLMDTLRQIMLQGESAYWRNSFWPVLVSRSQWIIGMLLGKKDPTEDEPGMIGACTIADPRKEMLLLPSLTETPETIRFSFSLR